MSTGESIMLGLIGHGKDLGFPLQYDRNPVGSRREMRCKKNHPYRKTTVEEGGKR